MYPAAVVATSTTTMASEFGRVAARSAFRTTSLLVRCPGPSRPAFIGGNGSSTPSIAKTSRNLNAFACQRRLASSGWTSPSGGQQKEPDTGKVFKRPSMTTYTFGEEKQPQEQKQPLDEFDLSPSIDLSMDDLYSDKKTPEADPNEVPPPPAVRLVPRLGKTVYLNRTVDFSTALNKMATVNTANQIKQTERMQKFHERAGLKRKRLRRMRWSKKFREGFKATVKRTMELTRQGW